jgi:hypothetical protein
MNYLRVLLVHDGKQKNVFAIHFANYIDLQMSLQSFLDFKKIIFNEIWTVVSMWKHYPKWRLANSISVSARVDYINTTL